jgi:hypothetical protein
MFGNPFGEDDFNQRLWNLIIFKTPLTDRELENAIPGLCFLIVIIGVIALLVWLF